MLAGEGVSSILTGDGVSSMLAGDGVSSTVYGASVVVVVLVEEAKGVGVAILEASSASRSSGWEGGGV